MDIVSENTEDLIFLNERYKNDFKSFDFHIRIYDELMASGEKKEAKEFLMILEHPAYKRLNFYNSKSSKKRFLKAIKKSTKIIAKERQKS